MDSKVEYWADLAEYDIETAEAMLATKRYLYVGFMCHQAIEKILKATLVSKFPDAFPPRTHNLHRLAEQAELYTELDDEQKELLVQLEPLNIQARYPEHKESLMRALTNDRCKALLNETKELLQWVQQKL